MSFIEDMLDDWLMCDEDEEYEFDDSFIWAEKQKPLHPGGVDWRYEKGGALYDE